MRIKLSKTAVKHGGGSFPFRWVSGLTKTEREMVKKGKQVGFESPKHHYSQSGFKMVVNKGYGWQYREPTGEELKVLKKKR
jgi:hypothetical protein